MRGRSWSGLGLVLWAACATGCAGSARVEGEGSTSLSVAALATRDVAVMSLTQADWGLRVNDVRRVPRGELGPDAFAKAAGRVTHRWRLVQGRRDHVLASGEIAAPLDVRLPHDAREGEPVLVLTADSAHIVAHVPYPEPGEHVVISGGVGQARWP